MKDNVAMAWSISSVLRSSARVVVAAALTMACDVSLAGQGALAGALNYSPLPRPLIATDWQNPAALPRVFRNHCHFDGEGRFYCSNHCGLDYQFYLCTPASFGCCRPGFGYCDWQGHLRCAPW
jgi:hypothetical protein